MDLVELNYPSPRKAELITEHNGEKYRISPHPLEGYKWECLHCTSGQGGSLSEDDCCQAAEIHYLAHHLGTIEATVDIGTWASMQRTFRKFLKTLHV